MINENLSQEDDSSLTLECLSPSSEIQYPSLFISTSALHQIESLDQASQSDGTIQQFFYISVDGGGCSGFQYKIDFVDALPEDALIYGRKNIEIGVDRHVLDFIQGSCIDYEVDLMGSSFIIKNPNAKTTCGCGSSFSIF